MGIFLKIPLDSISKIPSFFATSSPAVVWKIHYVLERRFMGKYVLVNQRTRFM
jgi:hypothetical protein